MEEVVQEKVVLVCLGPLRRSLEALLGILSAAEAPQQGGLHQFFFLGSAASLHFSFFGFLFAASLFQKNFEDVKQKCVLESRLCHPV